MPLPFYHEKNNNIEIEKQFTLRRDMCHVSLVCGYVTQRMSCYENKNKNIKEISIADVFKKILKENAHTKIMMKKS